MHFLRYMWRQVKNLQVLFSEKFVCSQTDTWIRFLLVVWIMLFLVFTIRYEIRTFSNISFSLLTFSITRRRQLKLKKKCWTHRDSASAVFHSYWNVHTKERCLRLLKRCGTVKGGSITNLAVPNYPNSTIPEVNVKIKRTQDTFQLLARKLIGVCHNKAEEANKGKSSPQLY